MLGGAPCRARELSQYNRFMLQHERAYLSKVMAMQGAFLKPEGRDAIMHDFADIDYFLSLLGDEGLVKAPALGTEGPEIEMWPASEGPIRPSQRKS